jgi:hypothetical protein
MKSLLLCTAMILALTASANAQCTYRMIDVGRPHGYIGGPCNGAAQNYAGAYPSKQRNPLAPQVRKPSIRR